MLKFNNYPPEKAGDVELGQKVRRDIELINGQVHAHYNAPRDDAFMLLGMSAARSVTETVGDIDVRQLEGVIEILKPVVDQIGEVTGESKSATHDTRALWFARGVFRAIESDLPAVKEYDKIHIVGDHHLFQLLIRGISQEAAESIARRKEDSESDE